MGNKQRNGGRNLTFGSTDREARERLRELVLFIAGKCEDTPTFGATKLNKILFYADFMSFALYGEPITGVPYKKLERGPVPTVLRSVRDDMERRGEIAVEESAYHNRVQQRIVPLREANLAKLKNRDIKLVNEVMEGLSGHNASQVSKMSHGRAWRVAEEGEPIPYEAVFLSDEGPDDYDIVRAQELISKYGWYV